MRISDWSSDVCSSYLFFPSHRLKRTADEGISEGHARRPCWANGHEGALVLVGNLQCRLETLLEGAIRGCVHDEAAQYLRGHRSEEHTSELQSLMRISYAVFCLKKKKETNEINY